MGPRKRRHCYFVLVDPFLIEYRKIEKTEETKPSIEFQISYLPDMSITPASFTVNYDWTQIPLLKEYLG